MENKPAIQRPEVMRMISANASNRELVRSFANLTPEKVVRGGFPSMALLKKEHGQDKIEDALAILIVEASLSFGDGFNKERAYDLAAEVITAYYYLTLEDCIIVLNRLKRTDIYGKFTPNKILAAFENYDKERFEIADELNYNKHLSRQVPRGESTNMRDALKGMKKTNKNRL